MIAEGGGDCRLQSIGSSLTALRKGSASGIWKGDGNVKSGISRRHFLGQAITVIGGLSAASVIGGGCAPMPTGAPAETTEAKATEPPKKVKEKISLRVQAIGGPYGQHVHDMAKRFDEDNPDIDVTVDTTPYGEVSQKTAMGFATGDLPDTLHSFTRWFDLGCYKGWYLELDDLLEKESIVNDYDDFFEIAVANAKWEGKTYDEAKAEYPELYKIWEEDPKKVVIPEAETLPTAKKRIWAGVGQILAENGHSTIGIVSHRVVNKLILTSMLGLSESDFWKLQQDTCCVNLIQYKDGEFTVLKMNHSSHIFSLKESINVVDF